MAQLAAGDLFYDASKDGYGITLVAEQDNKLFLMFLVSHYEETPNESYWMLSSEHHEGTTEELSRTYGTYIGRLNGRNIERLLIEKLNNAKIST